MKLRLANQELESRVAERTAELTSRNEELQGEVAERKRIAEENERQSDLSYEDVVKTYKAICEHTVQQAAASTQKRT